MSAFWIRYEGTRFPLRVGETLVGRSAYCTIVISDPSVSREHVALRLMHDRLVVVDLGSRNGTYVNGVKVDGEKLLQASDVVLIGKAALEVLSSAQGDSEQPVRRRSSTQDIVDDPTTESVVTLRLVERLIARAAEGDASPELVALIRNAIDSAVSRQRKSLSAHEAEQLATAADLLVSWSPDGSLDAWRAELAEKLAGTGA